MAADSIRFMPKARRTEEIEGEYFSYPHFSIGGAAGFTRHLARAESMFRFQVDWALAAIETYLRGSKRSSR